MGLPIDGWMVLWHPDNPDAIKVVPFPDTTGWARQRDKLPYSSGCCYFQTKQLSRSEQIIVMLLNFQLLVVHYKMNVDIVHQEFLKIDEYRKRIDADVVGAEHNEWSLFERLRIKD